MKLISMSGMTFSGATKKTNKKSTVAVNFESSFFISDRRFLSTLSNICGGEFTLE